MFKYFYEQMTSYKGFYVKSKKNIIITKRELEQEDAMIDRSFEGRREEQEEVEVAEGHELNVMPKNEHDKKREEIITSVISRGLSYSNNRYSKNRNQKQLYERNLKDMLNRIQRQNVLIHKISTILQPISKQTKIFEKRSMLVKQIQTELKQLQKQTSQIQRIKLANQKTDLD